MTAAAALANADRHRERIRKRDPDVVKRIQKTQLQRAGVNKNVYIGGEKDE